MECDAPVLIRSIFYAAATSSFMLAILLLPAKLYHKMLWTAE